MSSSGPVSSGRPTMQSVALVDSIRVYIGWRLAHELWRAERHGRALPPGLVEVNLALAQTMLGPNVYA